MDFKRSNVHAQYFKLFFKWQPAQSEFLKDNYRAV